MKHRWLKFIAICCATMLTIAIVILGVNLYQLFYQPMLASHRQPVIIQLDKSTTATSFVRTLKAQGFIKNNRFFLLLIRLQGLSSHLKAGIYQVSPGESAQQFLARVIAGDVLKGTFRIIEGTTQYQVSANLQHAAYLTYSAADWQSIQDSFPNAEGLLLADTYHYDAGSTSRDLLLHAHAKLNEYLQQSWDSRTTGLPYKSPYELLITASIIEKEASQQAEKRLIAGVVVNRLRAKMPLQMDPTVIYALGGHYTGKLSHTDMLVDSPYNSYHHRGLPPTPIAMVGKDAIDAAAHPLLTDYLYFVAKGDGSHHFSLTYEQQKQAIDRYLKKGR